MVLCGLHCRPNFVHFSINQGFHVTQFGNDQHRCEDGQVPHEVLQIGGLFSQRHDGIVVVVVGGDQSVLNLDHRVQLLSKRSILLACVKTVNGPKHTLEDQWCEKGNEPFAAAEVNHVGVVGIRRGGGDGGHQIGEVPQ